MTTEKLLRIIRENQTGKLSKTDWREVIYDTVDFILETKTELRTLGSLVMLEGVHRPFALSQNNPSIIDSPSFPEGLNTLAIWPSDSRPHLVATNATTFIHGGRAKSGEGAIAKKCRFWGITPNRQWLTVEVYIVIESQEYKPERFKTADRAESVTLANADFESACEFSNQGPNLVFTRLREVIESWSKIIREQHYQMENRMRTFSGGLDILRAHLKTPLL